MMQSGYTVKRYSEVPKTITLTRDRIFQLRFCRSLMYIYIYNNCCFNLRYVNMLEFGFIMSMLIVYKRSEDIH